MVGIVSGNSLGLNLNTFAALGRMASQGQAGLGQSAERSYVNIATGNLVVQDIDDSIVGHGSNLALRTYNSRARYAIDSPDHWSNGLQRKHISANGPLNQAGSTLLRTDADGAESTYAYDARTGAYLGTDGVDARDSIIASGNSLCWTDGASGFMEVHDLPTGRITGTQDRNGNAVSYVYFTDGAQVGLLKSVIDASGERFDFDYSAQRQLTQIRSITLDAGGARTHTRTRYSQDALGRLSLVTVDLSPDDNSIADGKTYSTAYSYDGNSSRLSSIVQSDGTRLGFTYAWDGSDFRIAGVTDGVGQLTRFDYDGTGRRTTVTDALGLQTVYEYDGGGRVLRILAPAVDGQTLTTSFSYNANGKLTRITDGGGRICDMQYDERDNQVLQRDGGGNTVVRSFDAGNRLLNETVYALADPDADGLRLPQSPLTTRHVYESAGYGLLRFTISAAGRVSEYRYNATGERVAAIDYGDALFSVAGMRVDATLSEAQMLAWRSSVNPAGVRRSDMAYDFRGQLQSLTTYSKVDAAGNGIADGTQSVQRYVYDQTGQLRQRLDALSGAMTSYVYDGLGRLLATTDAQQGVTRTTYDDAGNSVRTTFANGLVTTMIRNAAGMLSAVVQGGPDAARFGRTSHAYDAGGRLRMTTDPAGLRNYLLYDADGRKVADINSAGELTETSYDKSGQVARVIRYANRIDVAKLIDANGAPAVVELAAVRPASNDADSTSWSIYDSAGRLCMAVDGRGDVVRNEYDGAGRLVRVTQFARAIDTSTWAAVVAPSAISPVADPDDRITRNFFDADGLRVGQLDAEGYLTESRFDAAGQLVETIAYASLTAPELRSTGSLAALRPAATSLDVHQYRLVDGKGLVTGTIDGEGYLTECSYDLNGNLLRRTRFATPVVFRPDVAVELLRPPASPDDQVTSYTYTVLNQLASETAADGSVTRYDYDAAGNTVAVTRACNTPESRTTRKRYDLQGRLVAELSAEGAGKLAGLSSQADIDAVWNAYGLRHELDAGGRRIRTIDQLGHGTLYFYDQAGRLAYTVDATGAVEGRTWTALGQPESVRRFSRLLAPADLATLGGGTLGAEQLQLLRALADAGDSLEVYGYDKAGLLVTQQTLSGSREVLAGLAWRRDAFGAVLGQTERIDATQGVEQRFGYDHRGLQVLRQDDPAGVNATAATRYDAFGRVVETTGVNGNRSMRYDRNGRVVVVHDAALNADTVSTYDAFDRILTRTDGAGNLTRYQYDTQLRRMCITTAEGLVRISDTNRFGEQVRQVDANGNVTTFAYDANGRLKSVSDAQGRISANDYDRAGNLLRRIDALGTETLLAYDAANRELSRTVDPGGLNLVTRMRYDAAGRVLSVTDPAGVVTQTRYDAKGQVIAVAVDPDGLNLVTRYRYDGRGRTLAVTDPGGSVTAYRYDALGRRVSQTIDPGGLALSTTYRYDAGGNVVASIDPDGGMTRSVLDGDHRPLWQVDAAGGVLRTSYDALGRIKRTTRYAGRIDLSGLGPEISESDILGRLRADPAADQVQENVYDRDGRLAFTIDGRGAIVEQQFDGNGNVVRRIAYARVSGLKLDQAVTPDAARSAALAIADSAHDRLQINAYDVHNRLCYQIDGRGAVTSWTYDANGNVIDTTAYAKPIEVARLTNARPVSMDDIRSAIDAGAIADAGHDRHERRLFDRANRLSASAIAQGKGTDGVLRWAVRLLSHDANGRVVMQVARANAIVSTALPANPSQAEVHSWIAGAAADGARDSVSRIAYDAAGRAVYLVDAGNAVTQQQFDGNGNCIARIAYANVLQPTGILGTAQLRDALAASPIASVSRTLYDAGGRAVAEVDAEGGVTERVRDGRGNEVATARSALTINTAALPVQLTIAQLRGLIMASPSDRVERRIVDAAGALRYAVDAEGYVTRYDRDALGRIASSTQFARPVALDGRVLSTAALVAALRPDASLDRTSSAAFDAQGNQVQATDALGAIERWNFDALGQKVRYTNALSANWDYDYDNAGHRVRERAPQVGVLRTALDANGNLLGTAAEARLQTLYAYDALGNLISLTEAAGEPEERITRYDHDAAGRQFRTIFPTMQVYARERDDLLANGASGDAARVEQARSPSSAVVYDVFGNATMNTDVDGNASYRVYDSNGRVAFDIDAAGYVTGHGRDAFGREIALTRYGAKLDIAAFANVPPALADVTARIASLDHGQDRTLLTAYDRLDRKVRISEPLAYAARDSSDANGKLQTAYLLQRKVTAQRFNAFGELVETTVSGEDAAGNGKGMGQGAHRRAEYDRRGAKTAQFDDIDGTRGYLSTYAYDAAGNLVAATDYATLMAAPALSADGWHAPAPVVSVDDRTTRNRYDRANRKISETRSAAADGSRTTAYAYDALGQLTSTVDALNNVSVTRYDAMGRITHVGAPSAALLEQVDQLYVALTGTGPDAEAASAMTQRLARGMPMAQLAHELILRRGLDKSGNADFIAALYGNALARPPDPGAGAYWQGLIDNGMDRGELVAGFIGTIVAEGRETAFFAKVAAAMPQQQAGAVLTPITQFQRDLLGNVTRRIDFARSGVMTEAGVLVPASEQDRVTTTVVDSRGHARQEIDALGHSVFSAYDAQGRLAKQWQTVTDAMGARHTAFAAYRYDALGQLVETVAPLSELNVPHLHAASSVTSVNAGDSSMTMNRVALEWDALLPPGTIWNVVLDWRMGSADHPDGIARTSSFTTSAATGDTFTWPVDSSDTGPIQGIDRVRVYAQVNGQAVLQYDRTGAMAAATGISADLANGAVNSLTRRQVTFNAFGETIATRIDGETISFADYDAAGHLWRTNGGDGVTRVLLNDIEGRVTATLSARDLDLHADAIRTAEQANAQAGLSRTGLRYDLAGHVVEQVLASPDVPALAATAVRNAYVRLAIVPKTAASVGNGPASPWRGANSLQLQWGDLSSLGSGEVRVTIEKVSGSMTVAASQVYDAQVAARGVTLDWDGAQISRVIVAKKDLSGEFRTVLLRDVLHAQAAATTNLIEIAASTDVSAVTRLRYRLVGSTAWATVPAAQLVNFGRARVVDASQLADGRYEYEILEQAPDAPEIVRESGRWTSGVTEMRVQATQLYVLLFNRAPDATALAQWVDQLQQGKSLGDLAQMLWESPLARQAYPATLGSADVLARLFAGAPGIAADVATMASWSARFDAAAPAQKGDVLADLMFSISMYDGSDPARAQGRDLFNNKASVALTYAAVLGGADAGVGAAILTLVTATDTTRAVKAARDSVAVGAGAFHRQIAQLMALMFNRAPTAAELRSWVRKCQDGQSLSSVAQAMFDAGKPAAYPAGATAADIVTQFYRGGLGRAPDPSGLAYWTAKIDGGQPDAIGATALAIIDALTVYGGTDADTMASQRLFRNKVGVALAYADGTGGSDAAAARELLAKVTATDTSVALGALFASLGGQNLAQLKLAQLYVLLLNRAPEADGFNYWLAQWNTGTSLAAVAQLMVAAAPASVGSLSNADFIRLLYANGAGRAADAAGMAYWTSELAGRTRGDVAASFAAALATLPAAGTAPAGSADFEVFAVKVAAGLTYAMQGGADAVEGARNVLNAAIADRNADLGALAAQNARIAANIAAVNATAAAAQAANVVVVAAVANLEVAAGAAALANAQMAAAGTAAQAAQQAALAADADAAAKLAAAQAADRLAASAQSAAVQTNAAAKVADDAAARADSIESRLLATRAKAAADAAAAAYDKAVTDAGLAATAYSNAVSTARLAQARADSALAASNDARTRMDLAANALQAAQADYETKQTAAVLPNRIMAADNLQRSQVIQLYVLLFNRVTPDLPGVDYWITQRKNGQGFATIAQNMYVAGGLSGLSDKAVIEAIYAQAFGRTVYDAGGIAYWTSELGNAGANGKGAVFVSILNAVLGYSGTDPLGIATRDTLSGKISSALAALQSQQAAAAASLQGAGDARLNAQATYTSASSVAGTAYSTLQSANASLAQAAASSTTASAQNTAAQAEVVNELALRSSTAATAASTAGAAARADSAAVATAAAALAVSALSATQAVQWRTQAVQLHLMFNVNGNPDLARINGYVAQLASGTVPAQLALNILGASPLATLGNAALVDAVYRGAFGRTVADVAGQAYWTDQLANAGRAGYPAGRGDVLLNLLRTTVSEAGLSVDACLSRTVFTAAVARVLDGLAVQAASAARSAQASADSADGIAAQAAAVATSADQLAAGKAASVHWTSISVPATSAQLAVTRLYALLLNRAPDASGLNAWVDQVNAGKSIPQIADDMLRLPVNGIAPATAGNAALIHAIFSNALGRGDSLAESTWVAQLDRIGANGAGSKGQVLAALLDNVLNAGSSDAAAMLSQQLFNNKVAAGLTYAVTLGGDDVAVAARLFDGVSTGSIVAAIAAATAAVPAANKRMLAVQLFLTLRGSNPDLPALLDALGQLDGGQAPAVLAQSLMPATMAGMTNSQFVTELYRNAQGRTPDPDGLAYWTGLLATQGRGTVAIGIIDATMRYAGSDAATLAGQQAFVGKVAAALSGLRLSSAAASSKRDAERTEALAAAATAAQNAGRAAADALAADAAGRAAFDAIRDVLAYSGPAIGADRRQHIEMGADVVRAGAATPTIRQTTDRWGNLLTVTDARNPGWVSRFAYDADNHEILADLPDVDDASGITRKAYDALGRLVASTDANGNVSRQRYDAQGNLVEEVHADGGIVRHAFDALGNRIRTTNTRGNATSFDYDRLGHVTASHGPLVNVYGSIQTSYASAFEEGARLRGPVELTGGQLQQVGQRYVYDEMGRRMIEFDGMNVATRTVYDVRGNVIAHIDGSDRGTTQRYDAQNRMISQTDSNAATGSDGKRISSGKTMTWRYDAAGRLVSHTDLGGHVKRYDYNGLGKLSAQRGDNGQLLTYTYDSAGQLVGVNDGATRTVATYAYDAGGRRVRETTTHGGQVLQDNFLAYDALGRLRLVADGRYRAQFDYDAAGNRKHVASSYLDDAGNRQSHDAWNTFDAMNRQLIVNGIRIGGSVQRDTANKDSHLLTYDTEGNRIGDVFLGQNYRQVGSQRVIVDGDVTESYEYDALNRLTDIRRGSTAQDILHTDSRRYDAAGHMVQAGWTGELLDAWAGDLARIGVTTARRTTYFDAAGRMLQQSIDDHAAVGADTTVTYDGAGNLSSFSEVGSGRTYRYRYADGAQFDHYQASQVEVRSAGAASVTTNDYDVNGHLIGASEQRNGVDTAASRRLLENDIDGHVLRKTQNGQRLHALVVNGNELGTSGTGSADDGFSDPIAIDTGYGGSTAAYIVRAGDTLRGIARSVWGDASLWYLIADANALGGSSSLTAGQTITIPARSTAVLNGSDSFKPYDAQRMTGDLTPALPAPGGDGGCGAMGQVLMVAVAVAVTIYTAGVLTAEAGTSFSGIMAAGVGADVGAGTMAIASTVGNAVSQGAGIMMGMQEEIDWKQTGMAAIGGAVGQGMLSGEIGSNMVRAGIGSVLTQGIGVLVGAQQHFNWRGVAAAAVSAGVAGNVSDAVADHFGGDYAGRFAAGLLAGFAGGVAAAAMRSGRVNAVQVGRDAFGNALGNGIVESVEESGSGIQVTSSQSRLSKMDFGNECEGWMTESKDGTFNLLEGGLNFNPRYSESFNPSSKFDESFNLNRPSYALLDNGTRIKLPQIESASSSVRSIKDWDPNDEWEDATEQMPINVPLASLKDEFLKGYRDPSGVNRSVMDIPETAAVAVGRYSAATVESFKYFGESFFGLRSMNEAQKSWKAGNIGLSILYGTQAFGEAGMALLSLGIGPTLRYSATLTVEQLSGSTVSYADAGTGISINGAIRTVPLGFSENKQFLAAANELHEVLKANGITDAVIGVRGSSITGYSITKGTPFSRRSDIDFFIESGTLTDRYRTSNNIPGFVHPKPIMRDYPELREWSEKWGEVLGRKVTAGAFVPGMIPLQPAIIIR